MALNDYMKSRQQKIFDGRPLPEKKTYRIKPVSDKRAAKMAAQKEELNGGMTEKEKWFQERRSEMVGVCQCGCAQPNSKRDEANFRSCICHIFPQRIFKSVQFHRLNWVERKFWASKETSACHSQMDNKSMDLWPNMADWDDIKEKFKILAPLLTDKERKTKFYNHLAELVKNN